MKTARLFPLMILALSFSFRAGAQKELLGQFKPVCDSIGKEAVERFRVKSRISLQKALVRDGVLDLYFTQELGDFPWRSADGKWFRGRLEKLWPEKASAWKLGAIYCKATSLDELLTPELSYDGKPRTASFTDTGHARSRFVERIGEASYPRGLSGRTIALWQSHGRYFDFGSGNWSWQRSPHWRCTEDLYTQSYVLPFLIPMLERAGAYVLTPRERDVSSIEVICDNDPHFDSPGFPVRTHGNYSEEGSWSNAGTGFADKDEVLYGKVNPFMAGSARKAACVSGKGNSIAKWVPGLEENGSFAVYVSYLSLANSSRCASYTVHHRGGESRFAVDQTRGGGTWIYLGSFDLGPDSYVSLDNGTPAGHHFVSGSVVSADAVKIGGGMGKVARGLGEDQGEWSISGLPSYLEGAMYWEQWAGMDYDTIHQWDSDYTCDYASRGAWVKWMKDSNKIPFDMSLAFHTDAGVTPDDEIVGTLAIYTLKADGSRNFKDGRDRMACRMLCDQVQTQLVNDVREDYNPEWRRRQLWDRNYSESRTTDVPAMLLEFLAHQNFADMKFGLDPGFRFDACRAVYKGILKFFSNYYGLRYSVAPLPVSGFSACFAGGNGIRLSWEATNDRKEPTAAPSSYIVYTRIDDGAFDNGRAVKDNFLESSIEDGHVYSFMVEAVNDGGRSFPSEILSIGRAPGDAKTVLIVNNFDRVAAPSWFDSEKYAGFDANLDSGVPYIKDISYAGDSYEYRRDVKYVNNIAPGFGGSDTDMAGLQAAGNSFDYPSVHGKALLDLGYSFCSQSRSAFENTPAGRYFAIDIICGKQISTLVGNAGKPARYSVYPAAFRKALSASALAGSNILISGAYIAADAWDEIYPIGDGSYRSAAQAFCRNTLGFQWSTTRGSKNGLVMLDSVKLEFSHTLNEDIYSVETANAIRPVDKNGITIARYSNRTGAGICYPFPNYKVVAFGFPIETITNPNNIRSTIGTAMALFEEHNTQEK